MPLNLLSCRRHVALVVAGAILVCLGCQNSDPGDMFGEAANSKPKRIGTLYFQFQLNNTNDRLLGPASQEELTEFIECQNETGLEMIGVDKNNLDDLFISDHDGKPFKIRWEVQGVSQGAAQPVVFEQDGANGKYIVGFTGFIDKEVDKDEYDRLWSGAADNTPADNDRDQNSQ